MGELIIVLAMTTASAGLEQLAWTGGVGGLRTELTNKGVSVRTISRDGFTSGAGGRNPTADVFFKQQCFGNSVEFLAPSGLELNLGDGSRQDGSRWAMFEPCIYPDHFIIEYADGTLERWDVGSTEGDCIPFQVRIVGNDAVRVDNGMVVPKGGTRGSCADATASAIRFPSATETQLKNDVEGLRTEAAAAGLESRVNQLIADIESNSKSLAELQGEIQQLRAQLNMPNENSASSGGGSGSGGGGGGGSAGAIIGGIAVVGIAAYLLSGGGTAGEFAFSPDIDYEITESGYFASGGGRMDFYKDKWHLYYSATQTNRDGDFGDLRYTSGGEYKTDLWRATFSESVAGEKADYNFALSADFGNHIWKINPQFALDSEYQKGEWKTENSFRFGGEMRREKWRFWVDTDAHSFYLNALRRF